MNPKKVEYIGYLGTILSCITFIPQVYQTWKTKSVGDLSLIMVLIVVSSTIVWMTYAYLVKSKPIMLANAIVFILSLMMLYFKLTY
jgi:MtN3 and saliva related transmembrane protein